jgi:predicted RNA binding protein YcfA (HicA-like mRNA interferase family)
MKWAVLIRKLEDAGCELLRNGAKHDIYYNPKTGRSQPVPRHREVNDHLARKILRDLTEA